MGYPAREFELQVLTSHRHGEPVDSLQAALDTRQVVELQEAVRQVTVEETLNSYLLDIVLATRNCEELHVGASTRGALALYRAAQSAALIAGREFVVPDDIKSLAVAVLAHRVIPKGYLHGGQRQAMESLVERLVEDVPVPA
jgi:MoxR-like ATPase